MKWSWHKINSSRLSGNPLVRLTRDTADSGVIDPGLGNRRSLTASWNAWMGQSDITWPMDSLRNHTKMIRLNPIWLRRPCPVPSLFRVVSVTIADGLITPFVSLIRTLRRDRLLVYPSPPRKRAKLVRSRLPTVQSSPVVFNNRSCSLRVSIRIIVSAVDFLSRVVRSIFVGQETRRNVLVFGTLSPERVIFVRAYETTFRIIIIIKTV